MTDPNAAVEALLAAVAELEPDRWAIGSHRGYDRADDGAPKQVFVDDEVGGSIAWDLTLDCARLLVAAPRELRRLLDENARLRSGGLNRPICECCGGWGHHGLDGGDGGGRDCRTCGATGWKRRGDG